MTRRTSVIFVCRTSSVLLCFVWCCATSQQTQFKKNGRKRYTVTVWGTCKPSGKFQCTDIQCTSWQVGRATVQPHCLTCGTTVVFGRNDQCGWEENFCLLETQLVRKQPVTVEVRTGSFEVLDFSFFLSYVCCTCHGKLTKHHPTSKEQDLVCTTPKWGLFVFLWVCFSR